MNAPGKLGVVTVTYNSGEVLPGFLKSVEQQTHNNFILYAVDSGSTDDSIAQMQAWNYPKLHMIANAENVGIAEGNNQGIEAALRDGCEHVLFLNNDTEFEPTTFETLIAEQTTLACDLLAPKIWFADGLRIWAAGGAFNRVKGYLGFHIGEGEVDAGQFEKQRQIEHAPACCLLVRSAVFEKIGVMDRKYFVYWDDADFTFRALKAGLTMFYTPRARILHKVSSLTGGSRSVFTTRYNVRGHAYFMLKNLGLLRSLYYMPAWEMHLVYKLLSRSIGLPEFMIRQRAFIEGIGVWVSA